MFSFNKDNCNDTFYNTNIKLLTVILLNITHSLTMLSLQHTKLQSLQILQKIKIHDIYRKWILEWILAPGLGPKNVTCKKV